MVDKSKRTLLQKSRGLLVSAAVIFLLLMFGCSSLERRLLFYPGHHGALNGFAAWEANGEMIGVSRTLVSPRNVWVMLHGNAGQAADRSYALPCFSEEDSVFIMEYPGYGKRRGRPGKGSFNEAAREAYLLLRRTHPGVPVCVASESIGSGPACFLATIDPPPEKIVLIAPFAELSAVARDHFPAWLVKLLLSNDWNNKETLSGYKGRVDILAADADTIIAPHHARALAAAVTNANFTLVPGGHNDWSDSDVVKIRNP